MSAPPSVTPVSAVPNRVTAPRPISEPGCHTTPGWRGEPLRPARPDYATAPIDAAFDWHACLAAASGGPWYLVVFRSTRRADADGDVLTEFDDLAHLEARHVGGLLLYFKGEPARDGACLSLCLWESAEQARAARHLPRHQAAVGIAHRVYQRFALERYRVTRDPGSGGVGISPV
jgi:hypothetical protein